MIINNIVNYALLVLGLKFSMDEFSISEQDAIALEVKKISKWKQPINFLLTVHQRKDDEGIEMT